MSDSQPTSQHTSQSGSASESPNDSAVLQSLDPRVTRLGIPGDLSTQSFTPTAPLEHLETYEVFHQAKTGARHMHVGSVHAPSHAVAVLFAKEQFGRRSQTVNMWVVKTEDIVSIAPDDADFFTTTPDKDFREASGYKVMQKINAFKKARKEEQDAQSSAGQSSEAKA
jgi:ring-1,2-phenylacetyl-CoA epoxidase subunit PaaB